MAERSLRNVARRPRRLAFEPLETRQMLATITVTSLADNLDVDGQLTLREAIHAAELNVSIDGSPAGSAAVPDVIEFAAGVAGSVDLSLVGGSAAGDTALVIGSDVTIRGNANGITIQRAAAAPEMRLFRVTPSGDLTLESISLSKGIARGTSSAAGFGGGIYNEGRLRIRYCPTSVLLGDYFLAA